MPFYNLSSMPQSISLPDWAKHANSTNNSAFSTANDYGNSLLDYVGGHVDYERQLELLGLQNEFTADQNAKMMAFNADEAQKAREWQEMMSNTAYSRAMADAKKAGINPALIFSQGGASTPTGSSAYANLQGSSSSSRGYNNVANVVGALTGLAGSAMRLIGTLGLKR